MDTSAGMEQNRGFSQRRVTKPSTHCNRRRPSPSEKTPDLQQGSEALDVESDTAGSGDVLTVAARLDKITTRTTATAQRARTFLLESRGIMLQKVRASSQSWAFHRTAALCSALRYRQLKPASLSQRHDTPKYSLFKRGIVPSSSRSKCNTFGYIQEMQTGGRFHFRNPKRTSLVPKLRKN
eukprot:RCo032718